MNAPPTLKGRTIELRALVGADYGPLFDLVMNKVTTWRNLGQAYPPESFQQILWEHVHTLRVVTFKDTPEAVVGFVALTNPDLQNGLADLSIAIDPEAPETAGGEAALLFLHYTFATTAFRKIYAETTDLTIPWLGVRADETSLPGVVIEGRRRGAVIRGGEEVDLWFLTMDRERFLAETATAYKFATHRGAPQQRLMPEWVPFVDDLIDRFPELAEHREGLDGGALLNEDLGIDSLTLVEIVGWIEERFGGDFSEDDLVRLRSLQELYALVDADHAGPAATRR